MVVIANEQQRRRPFWKRPNLITYRKSVFCRPYSSHAVEKQRGDTESQLKQQSPGEENSNLVKMTRQDVEKAQATASMQFDAESPEQQQQQGQRLA